MRSSILALVSSLLMSAGAAAQTFTDKVTTTPIAIQDGFGPGGQLLGFNGLAYCGPTAFNMAIGYLGVNGYNRLGPTIPTPADLLNRERILSGLAGTSAVGGTTIDGLQSAVDTLLQAKGISLSDRSWNIANRPWVDDLQAVNVAPTVNVLLLGWYVDNSGTYRRAGGHFITLLDQAPNAQGTGTITINNPDPSSLVPAADTPAFARQTLQMTLWPHTSPDLPGPPYASSGRPGFLQFDPNQFPGWLGSSAVLETSIALTINPAVRDASYPQHPWTINAANRLLNTNGGSLDVTAPIVGSGGIEKAGLGTVQLLNTCDLTGTITVSGGLLVSTQASGSPIGTGSVRLNNGAMALRPAGSGGAVALTGVAGAGGTFSYGGGAELALDRGGHAGLSYTVGGGSGEVLIRNAAGTLVIAPASGTANFGSLEQFIINGSAPTLNNGMVAPSIVARDSDTGGSGDFLTYGSNGFARVAYTQSTSTPITSTTASTIYEVNSPQSIPAGQSATVQALKVGAFTVGGGAGSTLTVAGQGSPAEAGLILNGGTVSVPTIAFGSADVLAYASLAGGTITGSMTGSGRLVKFGPGTLTLAGVNSLSGPTIVQSGTLQVAAAGAAGSGTIAVQPEGKLAVAPGVEVAGPVTVASGGVVSLNGGSRLNNGLNIAATTGMVMVSGDVTIAAGSGQNVISGIFQAGDQPGVTTFQGATRWDGSSQFLVKLFQSGPGPTNIVTNSIHFLNPAETNFGSSSGFVNISLDLGGVPDPDSGDPFWTMDHTWVIADAASSWNNMWFSPAFVGYANGRFSVTADANITTMWLVYDYAPIPEPSAFVLVGFSAAAAWRWRRKSLRHADS